MAAKWLRASLALLTKHDREDALAEARAAAIEAASRYTTGHTTKWKTAANAANYALRKFLSGRRGIVGVPRNLKDGIKTLREADLTADPDAETSVDDDVVANSVLDTALWRVGSHAVVAGRGIDDSDDLDVDEESDDDIYYELQGEFGVEDAEVEDTEGVAWEIRPRAVKAPLSLQGLDRVIFETDERPVREVAAMTGLSEHAVRQRRHRLLARLAKESPRTFDP